MKARVTDSALIVYEDTDSALFGVPQFWDHSSMVPDISRDLGVSDSEQ